MQVLSGASRVLLKSKVLLRCSSAESFGFNDNVCKRLNIVMACGSRRSHKYMGDFLLVVQRHVTKWFLKIWIVLRRIFLMDVGQDELIINSIFFYGSFWGVEASLSSFCRSRA
jgi:hypothetical protein